MDGEGGGVRSSRGDGDKAFVWVVEWWNAEDLPMVVATSTPETTVGSEGGGVGSSRGDGDEAFVGPVECWDAGAMAVVVAPQHNTRARSMGRKMHDYQPLVRIGDAQTYTLLNFCLWAAGGPPAHLPEALKPSYHADSCFSMPSCRIRDRVSEAGTAHVPSFWPLTEKNTVTVGRSL